MKIKELIKTLDNFKNYSDLKDFEVKGISCNSKQVLDNFIFVAIKGTHQDGNRFIDEAIERGAKAVIVQSQKSPVKAGSRKMWEKVKSQNDVSFIQVKDTRKALAKLACQFYGNPSSKIKVIGITGTNGKTTITYLIEAILKEASFLPAVIGTINYRFKERLIPAKNTTPGPIELQSMLDQMVKEGIDYAIMEVSSHALGQDRVEGINFHSAIFTNLTQDHLDYHKTLEDYFRAKSKLFKNISPDSFVIINNDDRYGRRLKKLTKANIITFGIENDADILAKDIKLDCLSTKFKLVSPKGEVDFRSRLMGRHNVYNVLASVAWALQEGIDISIIKSSILGLSFVPGRLEKINFEGDFSVFVDYAHTEDALKNIIKTLRHLYKRRIIVVFGCGGERDKTKRPKMGRVVTELSDYAIITNDNPRWEDPGEIIKDIVKGIRRKNFYIIPQRLEAIRKSLALAKAGDVVLVAGKGHENYQILKDKTIYFDDCQVIRQCLKSMS